jgi:steroid 5-alpha reductase family enzyme
VQPPPRQPAPSAATPPPCNAGVFSACRHPNYLGEVLFWSGAWMAGVSAYSSWQHWACSGLGLAGILGIMLGATQRLEKKQEERWAGSWAGCSGLRLGAGLPAGAGGADACS